LGAYVAVYTPVNTIAIIFGGILIFSAYISLKKKSEVIQQSDKSALARTFKLNGTYPTPQGEIAYTVTNVIGGFFTMVGAGLLSGLLGVGSGALKVLAMDNIMRIPFKVSTTTSNFMIGVTAAASAGIYLYRGYIDPGLCLPVTLGVLGGALLGSRFLTNAKTSRLRNIFAFVIIAIALEMLYNGFTKKF
jgi:hypothetical protein